MRKWRKSSDIFWRNEKMSVVFEVYVRFNNSREEIFLKSSNSLYDACEFAEAFLEFIWLNSSLDLVKYVKIRPIEVDEK